MRMNALKGMLAVGWLVCGVVGAAWGGVEAEDRDVELDEAIVQHEKAAEKAKDQAMRQLKIAQEMAADGVTPFEVRFRKNVKLEKGTFLGVSTSEVTPALRAQVKLPAGVGLVVEQVEKGSPAESAGVKQFDVLYKVDDQMVINGGQLAVLVRMHKAGEEVKVTVLREGKEKTLTAKLQEKDVEPLEKHAWPGFDAAEWPMLDKRLQDLNVDLDGMVSTKMDLRGQGTAVMKDSEHSLTLTTNEKGSKHLVVKDKAGETIFDGPVNTEEERAKLPEGVEKKLKGLEKSMPMRLTLRKFPAFGEKSNVGKMFRSSSQRSITWSDEKGTITMKVKEGDKEERQTTLTVKDADGNLVFSGPIDTEEQRKALPEDIRKKLDGAEWKRMLQDVRGGEEQ